MVLQQCMENRAITKKEKKNVVNKKIIVNKSPDNRHSENKESGHDSIIKIRYRIVIRKPDRLTY